MYSGGVSRFIGLEFVYNNSSPSGQEDDDTDAWSIVSSNSVLTDDENWVCVEQDTEGNLHVESIDSPFVNNSEGPVVEELWEIVKDDYTVILSKDKKSKQKLDKKKRTETIVIGISTVALASVMPASSVALPFLLLSSVDLIKLGVRGRLSKLPFEQREATLQELLRRLAVKNSQLSAVTLVTAAASKLALNSLPVPLILLEQLSCLGLNVSTFELAEKAISGAACSLSSNLCLAKQKKQLTDARNKQKVMKTAMWGSVSGAAGGMIGPVLNSPIAEKCVMEACAATAKFSEQLMI